MSPTASRAGDGIHLQIADLTLSFTPPPGCTLEPPGWEYPSFLRSDADDECIQIAVSVRPERERTLQDSGTLLFDTGDAWHVNRLRSGALRFAVTARDRVTPWRMESEPPFSAWQLAVSALSDGATRLRHLVQYPLDQIILSHALYPRGGVLLHAAGASIGGHALLFAGVSGAGKSTFTRAMRGELDAAWLSDDRVFVRNAGHDAFTAHGTPWAGDAHVAGAFSAPLKALCFLSQADSAELRPLAPQQALDRLLPVTTLAWYDADLLQAGLATCEQLIECVACFELAFPACGRGVPALLASIG